MPREVIMPALGMAQDTARIVSWLKDPGDAIRTGDALMEVETDKAVMEIEAQADGFLTEVTAAAGDDVPVGHVIAIIAVDKPGPDKPGVDKPGTAKPDEMKLDTDESDVDTPDAICPRGGANVTDEAVSGHSEAKAQAVNARPAGVADLQPGRMQSGEAAPSGRILSSPKARRLALERGLDLARLVESGVPQPYHVADLDTLQGLDRNPPSDVSSFMQVTARVPACGCDEFIGWMANVQGVDLPARHVWLRFATAALRRATARDAERIVVEIRHTTGQGGLFADADRSRMSSSVTEPVDLSPDLVLRDFTGSPVTSASVSAGSASVLSVGRERDDYVMSFDYRIDQLAEAEALRFTSDFAERLGDPLLHLL